MTYQLIKGHPLIDGNKRVGYLCLRDFVERNGYEWTQPQSDGADRSETVATIEGVADGTVSQEQLANWISDRLNRGQKRGPREKPSATQDSL